MSIRNLNILFGHEIKQSLKGLLVFQLFLAPLSLWLIVNMIFGQTAIGAPRIGLIEEETSKLVEPIYQNTEVITFGQETDIQKALENGKLDMGILLSPDFVQRVLSNQEGKLTIYISGQSPLQRRLFAFINLQKGIQNLDGNAAVVNITPIIMGGADVKPWHIRLFPLIVLIAVMMGGIFIPATSFVADKQNKTLNALLIAPTSIKEVGMAKMLYGFVISYLMGLLILTLNQNLEHNTLTILIVLGFVAMTASAFGTMIGFVSKDMKSVTTLTQSIMLLLYAPAILNLFPQVPGFIQKLFPTYYLFSPMLKLSERTFVLSSDGWEILVLMVIFIFTQLLLVSIMNKSKYQSV